MEFPSQRQVMISVFFPLSVLTVLLAIWTTVAPARSDSFVPSGFFSPSLGRAAQTYSANAGSHHL